jgi:hypothetical protein
MPHAAATKGCHCVPSINNDCAPFTEAVDEKNDVAQALSRAKFWEADRRQMADKLLILLVGAQGLEPWTR